MGIRMMKIIACFLLVAMLLPVLCGCQTSSQDPQNAMIQAYIKLHDLQNEEANDISVEYLGCFEEAHVGLLGGIVISPAFEDDEIGGLMFSYPDSGKLQVYLDGEIKELSEAYNAGWLSDEALEDIWEKYKEVRPYMYD